MRFVGIIKNFLFPRGKAVVRCNGDVPEANLDNVSNRKYSKARFLSSVLAILLLTSITGCGKQDPDAKQPGSSSNSQTNKAVDEPYEFTIFRTTWTDLDADNDLVIQELNRRLNIKIRILSSTYETWKDRYTLLMSSGEVPDISITTGPGTLSFNKWAAQGKYLDITDLYYKYCPNIVKNVPDELIERVKIKGRLYGIPRPTVSDRALIIRADWLDKLNLEMPGDVDELYNVLKAFTQNDPDGNGESDTYGLLGEDTLTAFQDIFEAFGCPLTPDQGTHWYVNDEGRLESVLTHPNVKDAVKYLRKLYKEKLLDQEWMLTKSQAFFEKIRTGKGGCTGTSVTQMLTLEIDMQKNWPSVRFEATNELYGPNGEFQRAYQDGWYMMASISGSAKKPEKLLHLLDYCMSDEGYTLLRYGIEGITYRIMNDEIIVDYQAALQHGVLNGHKLMSMMSPAKHAMPENERTQKYLDMLQVYYEGPFKPSVPEEIPSLNVVTTKQGPDMVRNMVASIICGDGDVDAEWDRLVDLWLKSGGEQLLYEVNEIYERNK
ncbi:MAG TPA: extracellular solute-binding protein [Clostridiaceae bacterium]|nr:extracellular solute-binding protein [Clostridiaceae bacterium]